MTSRALVPVAVLGPLFKTHPAATCMQQLDEQRSCQHIALFAHCLFLHHIKHALLKHCSSTNIEGSHVIFFRHEIHTILRGQSTSFHTNISFFFFHSSILCNVQIKVMFRCIPTQVCISIHTSSRVVCSFVFASLRLIQNIVTLNLVLDGDMCCHYKRDLTRATITKEILSYQKLIRNLQKLMLLRAGNVCQKFEVRLMEVMVMCLTRLKNDNNCKKLKNLQAHHLLL